MAYKTSYMPLDTYLWIKLYVWISLEKKIRISGTHTVCNFCISINTGWNTRDIQTLKTSHSVEGCALGGRGVGNLVVIVVQVFQPVFRNLPHSYTWPLKKRTHSYTRSSEMLTHSDTAFDFCTHLLLVVRQLSQSIH